MRMAHGHGRVVSDDTADVPSPVLRSPVGATHGRIQTVNARLPGSHPLRRREIHNAETLQGQRSATRRAHRCAASTAPPTPPP